ncbi:MAG: hypothetical protein IKW80_04705 [Thermoguttaceae bacterium]|nr:hypothetical protein [Thermoguttaceae bacterium]
MSNNIRNKNNDDKLSLLISLTGGFVVLLLYLLLCSFDFCPLSRCFCAPGGDEINWDVYGKFTMYFVIGYAVYAFFVICCFAQKDRAFRNFKSSCVDYMDIFMRMMFVGSILLFTEVSMFNFFNIDNMDYIEDIIIYKSHNSIKDNILTFYTASVIVSIVIIPVLVLTILLQSLYSMIFIKRGSRNDCVSTDNSETEDNNESTERSFWDIPFNKESIVGEFFYRYSLLVLWGILGPLILFFIAPRGGNGWAGIFLAFAIDATYNLIYIIIWYLAFSIVLRRFLKLIVSLIIIEPPQNAEG